MRTGRVVLVSGAAGGIGSALVARFLENGDRVIATDSTESGLDQLRGEAATAEALTTVPADITAEEDVRRVAEVARAVAGRIDVLVNGAGYFPILPFAEMTPADWQRVIDVNLTGPFLLTRAVVPLMTGRGWGRIINFGSASVFDGTPGQSHYVAAKAGIVGFSRSLARELGAHGITVNTITPGLTVTAATRERFPAALLEAQRSRRAVQRDEVPADLVGPVFFLASPDAGFISGQTLNVDGGKFME